MTGSSAPKDRKPFRYSRQCVFYLVLIRNSRVAGIREIQATAGGGSAGAGAPIKTAGGGGGASGAGGAGGASGGGGGASGGGGGANSGGGAPSSCAIGRNMWWVNPAW